MLVLQRHLKQSIYIGENKEIQVKILCMHDGSVTLGIDAPRNIPVFLYAHETSNGKKARILCNEKNILAQPI